MATANAPATGDTFEDPETDERPSLAWRLAADLEDQATVLRRDGGETRIPRTILEDRYHGLIVPPDDRGFTKLGIRLHHVLEDLVLGTARHGDPEAHDGLGGVVQEAHDTLRALIIDRIDSRGIAR